jgi:hypothetical protein
VELTAQYGWATNTVRVNFEKLPWQHLREQILLLDCEDETGKSVGLESFIERLMGGTRLRSVVEKHPNMEEKNILTIIEKTDKILSRQAMGYKIMPHYEILCDVAHPNTIGFQRYLLSRTCQELLPAHRRGQPLKPTTCAQNEASREVSLA